MLLTKIADIDEIQKSKRSWNNLVNLMKFPVVFLTWEWITIWIKNFQEIYVPLIIFVYENTELKAIAPLALRKVKLANKLMKVRLVSMCGSLELFPDHLDIICNKDDSHQYAKIVLDYLMRNYRAWDVMYLPFLAENGKLNDCLVNQNFGYHIIKLDNIVSPYMKINKSFESYLTGFDRKKRYNLIRENKLLINKDVSLVVVKEKFELEKSFGELLHLHKARANDKNILSTFNHCDIISFHKEVSLKFLELGWLKIYMLKNIISDETISVAYGFEFNNRFSFYQTGFDPEWKQFSPGKVLIFNIVEDLHNKDVEEFDFLGGNDSYKKYWTKDYRVMSSFFIFNKNVKGNSEYYIYYLKTLLKDKLTKLFDNKKSI